MAYFPLVQYLLAMLPPPVPFGGIGLSLLLLEGVSLDFYVDAVLVLLALVNDRPNASPTPPQTPQIFSRWGGAIGFKTSRP